MKPTITINGKEIQVSKDVKDYVELLEIQLKSISIQQKQLESNHYEFRSKMIDLLDKEFESINKLKPELINV